MRTFLQAYVDHEIVVATVATYAGRGTDALVGTLLAVGDQTITLKTIRGDEHVLIDQIVEFRPKGGGKLPASVTTGKEAPTKALVMEAMRDVEKALKARAPEAEVRLLLGKVIHGATKVLARRADDELEVAKEKCSHILTKCSDPTLPPDED